MLQFKIIQLFSAIFFVILTVTNLTVCFGKETETALDQSLKPEKPGLASDDLSSVLVDMGVVQGKAITKSKKILLATFLTFDFSDGPYSMYGAHINPGYALSDFFELYVDFAPFFINQERAIIKDVRNLTLQNGQQANIVGAKAKMEYGIEALWAPLYGKDSFGLKNIIRSDAFLKLGVMQIKYDQGNGMRYELGIGKTFFVTSGFGVRLGISMNYVQTIVQSVKSYSSIFMVDIGGVGYFF